MFFFPVFFCTCTSKRYFSSPILPYQCVDILTPSTWPKNHVSVSILLHLLHTKAWSSLSANKAWNSPYSIDWVWRNTKVGWLDFLHRQHWDAPGSEGSVLGNVSVAGFETKREGFVGRSGMLCWSISPYEGCPTLWHRHMCWIGENVGKTGRATRPGQSQARSRVFFKFLVSIAEGLPCLVAAYFSFIFVWFWAFYGLQQTFPVHSPTNSASSQPIQSGQSPP